MAFCKPSNVFTEVASILKSRSAAVRTEDDLYCIRDALDPTLIAADAVWASLCIRQKLVLCKHFELKTVFDGGGQILWVERMRGASTKNGVPYTGGLYILIHGKATVSICGGPSLLVHGGSSKVGQLGQVLGRLSIPSGDAKAFFNQEETNKGTKSLYNRFVSFGNRQRDVTIKFDKGSTYVVLPESLSRQFLSRLNASLTAKRVLNDVGIITLLHEQTHQIGCANESTLLDGKNKATKVFQFHAGQILIKEGDYPNQVLFVATGSCLILRSDKDEVHCIGSVSSPSFVGVSEIFNGSESDGMLSGHLRPVSAVAAVDGYAFSFCSLCFLSAVDKATMNDGFRLLGRLQMKTWAIRSNAANDEEETKVGPLEAHNDSADDKELESASGDDELLPQKGKKQRQSLMENANENLVKGIALPEQEEIPDPFDINEKILSTGRLNRSKFLSAMHETLSNGLCRVDAADTLDATERDDTVREREKWLVDGDKSNILADVITALTEGYGVDFARCEGENPFHDFCLREELAAASPDCPVTQMKMALLRMPPRMPHRLQHMEDKSLGRKRPPEYDDSDPFLKPCPSVVSRKMHGKTLSSIIPSMYQRN